MASTVFSKPVNDEVGTLQTNLGSPSSASGVTGTDAFSKINTLNGNINGHFNPSLPTNPTFADIPGMTMGRATIYGTSSAPLPNGNTSGSLIHDYIKISGNGTYDSERGGIFAIDNNGQAFVKNKGNQTYGTWHQLAYVESTPQSIQATTASGTSHKVTFPNNDGIYIVAVTSGNGNYWNVYIVRNKTNIEVVALTAKSYPTHSASGRVLTFTTSDSRTLTISVIALHNTELPTIG